MKKDVVISGMGAVTAVGIGVERLKDAAFNGKSGIDTFEYEWSGHNPNTIFHGGKVKDFVFTDHFTKSQELLFDPFTAYGLLATQEALENSGLTDEDIAGSRTAVIFGTGLGGATTFDQTSYRQYDLKEKRLSPFTVPKIMPNAAASHICIKYKINGPSFTIATACASSTQAIGIGLNLIRSGIVDRAIVGGSEALISPGVMRTWEVMRALSTDALRPFSKDRSGTVLGEGSGMLVLESVESIKKRNGKALAYLMGFGTTTDGVDIVKPDIVGTTLAIEASLLDAGVSRQQIKYINAHGTGTILNDANECAAIRKVFGKHADNLSVSSTKPITGHVLGGTGALETIITVLAMEHSYVPPTINYNEFDLACDLDVTPLRGKSADIPYAMTNSFAFGGINAVLTLGNIKYF